MAVQPDGTPCWVDAMFPDIEGAKSFYGELLGWTFGDPANEFGGYTTAYSDGKAVGAIVQRMPGMDAPAAWTLYFAASDAAATTAKIRQNGGTVAVEPMAVGDLGTMVLGADPSGVSFGAWQAGKHQGFEKKNGEHGAYAWSDVCSREVARTDAFFPAVFPFHVQRMDEEGVDFRLWSVGADPVAGRMKIENEFPPDAPPFINVHFSVPDADAAAAKTTQLGGKVLWGPMDSPFGRFATVTDQQGAVFTVFDLDKQTGEPPRFI
ncbi:VOC family protein [Streptomyces albipurpureus]|uniref:VOC family protein n=1 Tax=Streptomyces albipurpureus TaxID=2897419 RepID=A0ABT0UKS1_9ACTN|nr:VOC family protein [Streptomyces sp. CWNU-1]MCM2388614.1 VOC family protein [Streptomyces sp. CWNU-1]